MVTANKLAYVGSTPEAYTDSRDSDSWYTPISYVEDARYVFGGEISLDPFSSDLLKIGLRQGCEASGLIHLTVGLWVKQLISF